MVLPHFSLDWLWYCFSVFLWFYLMLHWIDCGIVYLCSHGSSSCCIGLIVTLLTCVLMVLPHVAQDWFWHCLSVFLLFFLMLYLIVTLFICVFIAFHVVYDWLWHCLSVFSWFFLMLHWIDCDIVYFCSHGSSSCCIGLIVTLFICNLMVLPHFALDWLWHCLSVFSQVFLMLHWIDCDIVCLWSPGPSSCCIGLIVTLFICVRMGLPHVAFDWLDIVYLCFYGSSSCCIGLIVTLFICVLIGLPHVALDWLCIVYLCSHGSS